MTDHWDQMTPDEQAGLKAHGLERSGGYLNSFDDVDELGPPDLDAGTCGECGDQARQRWSLGLFQLCGHCRRRRARARRHVPDTELDVALARKVRQETGPRDMPDDPFDLLEEAPY